MLKIRVYTLLTSGQWEELEDKLSDWLVSQNIHATINNTITSNIVQTRPKCNACGEYIDTDDLARDCCDKCLGPVVE